MVATRGVALYDRRVSDLHAPLLEWYDAHARDLPWRRPDATPWGVLVSEFMLQQTPVARVLPVYDAWLARWPRPADLAAEPSGEAIRAWGRLGYPRRAIRLHAAATVIRDDARRRGAGLVRRARDRCRVSATTPPRPCSPSPSGDGSRCSTPTSGGCSRGSSRGVEFPPPPSPSPRRPSRTDLLPDDEATAATWSVALMELGALVCTAASPRCDACPVQRRVRLARGRPPGVRRSAAARPGLVRAPTGSAAAG